MTPFPTTANGCHLLNVSLRALTHQDHSVTEDLHPLKPGRTDAPIKNP